MRRSIALLLSVLLMMSALSVSADNTYNDDRFDWGEFACPHTHTETVAAIPSTCITQGCGAYVRCTDCCLLVSGSKEPLPLADHAYDHACDADCNVCGAVREVEGHQYKTVVIAPDCENSGYTVHTCSACGHSYADSRVDALGHCYRVTEEVYPTCVADGKKVYTCAACGDTYTDIVPATGRHTYDFGCDEVCNVCGYVRKDAHTYTYMGRVEPTCGEDGSDGYKCWDCGNYKYVILPATGLHTYSGVCDAACNVCGFVRSSVVPHNYAVTDAVEVTCTTDGTTVYTCQYCGDRYTETVAAQGHMYDIVITAPTCEQGGYTTHTCRACGDVCVDNRTEALGHSYGLVAEELPTCVDSGKKSYVCRQCGDGYTDTIPATGEHVYDDVFDARCNTCGGVRQPLIRGDADESGKVNNRDLGLLLRFLNEWSVTINEQAVDLDGNGKVTNLDVGLLQRLLNE